MSNLNKFGPFDYIGLDSGVIKIPESDEILKFYPSLAKQSLIEYHEFHNKTLKKTINLEKGSEIYYNQEKFRTLVIEGINLNNNFYSLSQVENKLGETKVKKILKYFNEKDWFNVESLTIVGQKFISGITLQEILKEKDNKHISWKYENGFSVGIGGFSLDNINIRHSLTQSNSSILKLLKTDSTNNISLFFDK